MLSQDDTSIEIQSPEEEEAVKKQADEYEYYKDVEYTGRENPWDLVMWGLTKAHPNIAKTAEFGRLAIAKPVEFIGNVAHKGYEILEDLLIDKKKDFLGPFATLLGAVVKGMLTGNETESRLDNFETVVKRRKISDVVNEIANEAEKISEKEVKQNLGRLEELANNNSKSTTKTENTQPVIKNLNGDHIPASNATIHHQEHFLSTNPGKSKTHEQVQIAGNHLNALLKNDWNETRTNQRTCLI